MTMSRIAAFAFGVSVQMGSMHSPAMQLETRMFEMWTLRLALIQAGVKQMAELDS